MTYPRSHSEWQYLDLKPNLADSCTLTRTLKCLLNDYITEFSGDVVRNLM